MFSNNANNEDSKNSNMTKEIDSESKAVIADSPMEPRGADTTKPDNASAKGFTEANLDSNTPITGHGVFTVSLVPQGVAIHTGFLADGMEDLLAMPAIFPNIESALAHLDDLRRLVIVHFGQIAAAQGALPASLNELPPSDS